MKMIKGGFEMVERLKVRAINGDTFAADGSDVVRVGLTRPDAPGVLYAASMTYSDLVRMDIREGDLVEVESLPPLVEADDVDPHRVSVRRLLARDGFAF